MNSLSIRSVMSKSEMTPSRRGRMATILPGGTAQHLLRLGAHLQKLARILVHGHHGGLPQHHALAFYITRIDAVPRSIPISLLNIPAPLSFFSISFSLDQNPIS